MTSSSKPLRWVVKDVLPQSAWTDSPAGERSSDLTPLYVIRQRGPFLTQADTFHDHWEMIAVRGGAGTLSSPKVDLREPVVCLIPPGLPHHEISAPPLDLIWMGVRGRRLHGLDHGTITTLVSSELSDMMERLWLFAKMTPGVIGPELDAMAMLIVARFLRLHAGESDSGSDRIERAIRLFHERLAEPHSMIQLAKQLGCSPSYFTREFRRRTGQTPITYLTGIRIQSAARLLETTTMAVNEIAEMTGFADAFYFSRVFKRVMHTSPALWRNELKESREKRAVPDGAS
jgi:AraC-like DNA-binding protein